MFFGVRVGGGGGGSGGGGGGGVTVKTSHEKQYKQQQKHHVQKQPTYMSELQKSTSNSTTEHCDTTISYHHIYMFIYTAESQLLPTPHTLKLKCDRLIPSMQIVAKTHDICVFFSIQT